MDSATCPDHGGACRRKDSGGARGVLCAWRLGWVCLWLEELDLLLGCEYGLGRLQEDRPGTSRTHLPKRLMHQLGHLRGPVSAGRPFRHRACPALVRRIRAAAVDVRARYDQHRRGYVVSGGEARGRVEEARPLHHDNSRDLVARPEVPVGHVCRGLLVTHRDVAHVVRTPQRVHYLILPRTRYPEHCPNTLAPHGAHQGLPASHDGQGRFASAASNGVPSELGAMIYHPVAWC